MATTIEDTAMHSDITPVRALYDEAAAGGNGAWLSTDPRLTGRHLTRNEAITSMTLAEHEAAGKGGDVFAVGWREELGIGGQS